MDRLEMERSDGLVTVTLARPMARNALDRRLVNELRKLLRREVDDADALVLTGGGDAFCAGGDLDEVRGWTDAEYDDFATYLRGIQEVVKALRNTDVPSVAAVNGPAVGAGCDLALACDLRIVGPDAVFREGFVELGLVPGDGGAWLLARLLGESRAKEYVLTGKDIPAAEAVDVGLAVELALEPLETAHEYAESFLERTKAVRYCNRLIDDTVSFETHLDRALEYQWDCATSDEHALALAAAMDGESDRPD